MQVIPINHIAEFCTIQGNYEVQNSRVSNRVKKSSYAKSRHTSVTNSKVKFLFLHFLNLKIKKFRLELLTNSKLKNKKFYFEL